MNIFCTGNPNKKYFYDSLSLIKNLMSKYNVQLYIDSQIDLLNKIKLDKLSFKDLKSVIRKTTHTTSYIFALFVGATMFALVLRGLGSRFCGWWMSQNTKKTC